MAASRSLPLIRHAAPPTLAAAILAATALYLRATRGMTFHDDDWSFVLGRQDWDADAFLDPHDGHLMLVTAALYKALFEIAGADYAPYRAIVTAELGLVVALLFAYARTRVGDGWALVAALLVLFCGKGYEAFLWPVNTGLLTALVGLLVALLALDRDDRRGDRLAALAIALSLASSSVGAAIALGVVVEALCSERRRERLPLLAVPIVLYVTWRIGYDAPGEARADNAGRVLPWGADLVAASAGGLIGVGLEWGRVVLAAGIAALVWRLASGGRLTPRLAMLLVTPLAYVALTALARATLADPTDGRYVFVTASMIVLAAVEAARGARLRDRRLALAVAALVALAIPAGLLAVRDGGRLFRGETRVVAAELGAMRAVEGVAFPSSRPDPVRAPQIALGPYFTAVARMGGDTPAWTLDELRHGPVRERIAADRALLRVYDLAPIDPPDDRCSARTPPPEDLALAPGEQLRVRALGGPARARAHRFAPVVGDAPPLRLPADRTLIVAVPVDRAPDPWRLSLEGAPVQLCGTTRP